MSETVRTGKIAVDGAELYYEERGAGQPVLLIQGGISEAGATTQLAEKLAGSYHVISYDRRGVSRSGSMRNPPVTMNRHGDDAATLLAAVTDQPAYVVGASIGALIGLHIAGRHPDQLAILVAHEPPISAVHSETNRERDLDGIAELAHTDPQAAIQLMAALHGTQPPPEPGASAPAPAGDVAANLDWFFAQDFPAVRAAGLGGEQIVAAASKVTIVPTGGEDEQRWEYRCSDQIAQLLARDLQHLPGGHNGLVSHPWATAKALQQIFLYNGTQ